MFTSLNTHVVIVIESSPSFTKYNELHNSYSNTLQCSCSNISVFYSNITAITPCIHQICSSDLMSSDFITALWGIESQEEYAFNYDRKILSSLFRVLSSFCTLTRNTIEQNRKTFSTKQIITLKALTRASFESQSNSIIDNFIVQTLADFQWIHHYIIDMFHGNQLVHKFNLNWNIFKSNAEMNYFVRTFPIWFNQSGGSCLCTTSPLQCFRSILTSYNQTIQIPGETRLYLRINT